MVETLDAIQSLSFDDKLKTYYGRLFPFDLMYEWLSYCGPGASAGNNTLEVFSKRELSFTLKDDIYIRYLSYADAAEWKAGSTLYLPQCLHSFDTFQADMIKRTPHKIDMGAVYNMAPKQKSFTSKDAFKEVEREFILDIDLTDYQDDGTIKTNCVDPGDADFKKSFRFMGLAVRILDKALRKDFGFKHLLWVFSGRRGIHCWVCDKRARIMSNAARSAVVDYLNVFKGGEKDKSKMAAASNPLHPSLRRALEEELVPAFPMLLEDQGWLDSADRWTKTLELLPDPDMRETLLTRWTEKRKLTPTERWDDLLREARRGRRGGPDVQIQLMLGLAYPRLDVNVSKAMNHLLKAPFCVHPKTLRLCVPLDPTKIQDFDPAAVPTLDTLLRDLAASTETKVGLGLIDPHRHTFRHCFLNTLSASVAESRRSEVMTSTDF